MKHGFLFSAGGDSAPGRPDPRRFRGFGIRYAKHSLLRKTISVILLLTLLFSLTLPLGAEEYTDIDVFLGKVMEKMQQQDVEGAAKLIKENPVIARQAFKACMSATERGLSSMTMEEQDVKMAEMVLEFIAEAFRGVLNDESLKTDLKNHRERLAEIRNAKSSDAIGISMENPEAVLDYLEKKVTSGLLNVRENSDDVKLLNQLPDLLLKSKKLPPAIRAAEIIARCSDNFGFYGKSIEVRSEFIKVVAAETKNIGNDPLIRIYLRLGNDYLYNFDFQKARLSFEKARELAGKTDSDMARLGLAVADMGLAVTWSSLGNEEQSSRYRDLCRQDMKQVAMIPASFTYEHLDFLLFIEMTHRLGDIYARLGAKETGRGNTAEAAKYYNSLKQLYTDLAKIADSKNSFINRNPFDAERARVAIAQGYYTYYNLVGNTTDADTWCRKLEGIIAAFPRENVVLEDSRVLKRMYDEKLKQLTAKTGRAVKNSDEQKQLFNDTLEVFAIASANLKNMNDFRSTVDVGLQGINFFLDFVPPEIAAEMVENHLKIVDDRYQVARTLEYRQGIIEAIRLRGRLESYRGNIKKARDAYLEALELLEKQVAYACQSEQEKQALLQLSETLYRETAEILVKNGESQLAFETLNRLKGNQLVNSLDLTTVKVRDAEAQQHIENAGALKTRSTQVERELSEEKQKPEGEKNKEKIKRLSTTLASTKAEFFKEITRLRETTPEYEQLLAVKPIRFASVQKLIPADTIMVQYLPAADKLYVFLVTSDSFRIKTVDATKEQIDGKIRNIRETITRTVQDYSRGATPAVVKDWNAPPDQSTRELIANLKDLRSILITPLEEEIASKKVVAVIPTGLLCYLPFQALAKDTDKGVSFLIEEKQVVYLNNADLDMLIENKEPKSIKGVMLAVGNPDGSLQSAEAEAMQLKKMFPDATVYVRKQATKDKIKQLPDNTKVLHLATHGVLNSENVNESFILLAGTGQDSKLKQGEIYELPLAETSLVTLSACQTALEKNAAGAEIFSLATAFSIAGAPSVIATLWSISDSSTGILISELYLELKNGKTKAEALQAAQVKLLKDPKHANPFYWAPFILMGDWR